MNVSFTSSNLGTSQVIDTSTGEALFAFESGLKLAKVVTTMRDANGQVVAEYDQRTITFHGEEKRVVEWLPSQGFFTISRVLTTSDGKKYTWKLGRSMELVDPDTGKVVAQPHRASLGALSQKRDLGIDVQRELVPFLDAVVLSFVILETERLGRTARTGTALYVGAASSALAGNSGF